MASKSVQPHSFGTAVRRLMQSAVVFAGVALTLAPGQAHAKCSFSNGTHQGTYSVPVQTTFVNDPEIAVGDVLLTLGPVGIDNTVKFTCDSWSDSWGLLSGTGGQLPAGVSVFPTGTAGIGYRVSQNNDHILAYPYFSLGSSNFWQENDPVTIELIKTGAIVDGSSVSGTLARFKAGTSNKYIIDAVIELTNKVTFIAPACQIAPNKSTINVKLPTVTRQAFSGVGTVAGTTPFQIVLTCSSGAKVALTLDTSTAVSGSPGVIAPSSGNTSGIGVQVLDSSGVTPVSFGNAKTIGATPNGALLVNYFARYYQTGNTVGTGLLGATATFTLSYQ